MNPETRLRGAASRGGSCASVRRSVGSVNERLESCREARYESGDSPRQYQQARRLRSGESGSNIAKLTHIMPQDFSDFAHLCV